MSYRDGWARCIGVVLYLVTLAWDAVTAGLARVAIGYVFFGVLSLFVTLPVGVSTLAFAVAAIPTFYSLTGVLAPGPGILWQWMVGGRNPIGRDVERVEDALEVLSEQAGGDVGEARFHVIDGEILEEGVRGQSIFLSTELVYSEYLVAVLAHAMGHLRSWDGRLTEGLHRLSLWGDVLAPVAGEPDRTLGEKTALAWLRVVAWVAGGGVARVSLGPIWACYWRWQEYRADEYAVSLGQRDALRECLEVHGMAVERVPRGVSRLFADHPPVAYRVERLERLSDVEACAVAGGCEVGDRVTEAV